MKIAIVNSIPIPSGEASVNRLLSYSKELVSLGNAVSVLSAGKANAVEGTIDGVLYHNYGCKKSIPKLFNLLKDLKIGRFDRIIIVSNSLLLIWPVACVAKFSHIPVLQEKSEFPFVMMKKGFLNRIYAKLYINTTYRIFDGMIVMTKPLIDFFKNYVNKDCKLFEMPMTVDTERFDIEPQKNSIGNYFAYCGNLSNRKDGIINLLDSFVEVERKYSDVKLVLIGGTNDQDYLLQLKRRVDVNGLKNVVFYGKVSRDEMPSLLKNARGLLLARPSNLQSSGGFPTKLGEYLSTGKPVVVTAVGDIPLYLNETNSFIVPPDNIEAFSSAMLTVLDNYEKALLIGKKGRELALSVFNAKVQAIRLESYLHSLS